MATNATGNDAPRAGASNWIPAEPNSTSAASVPAPNADSTPVAWAK